jgi:hypothetical protein
MVEFLSCILHVLVSDFHVWCLVFNLNMFFHNLFWVLCSLNFYFFHIFCAHVNLNTFLVGYVYLCHH